ncbi:MAG: primary-amine oxidase [Chloroflexota bacterium]|nr:primary-amine oxidase [Chloroflexota bacterium]MDQ6907333.1 primary-amine oxidase [Chloroflexota bacterium]
MTVQLSAPEIATQSDAPEHPLTPVTAGEIMAAVALVRASGRIGERVRFASITLQEPPKEDVLHYRAGDPFERHACIVLLDTAENAVYEVIVSITQGRIVGWEHIPGVQPQIMYDEFVACEAACKADPAFRAALAKRGVTDMDLVMVEPWSAGDYGDADDRGMRLTRALMFVRSASHDNGYARPVEGLVAVVDLNAMRIVRLEDAGVVPLPPEPGNYAAEYIPTMRTDLKPIAITQPEGTSSSVDGHAVTWQKWHFRIGFTPREGLVLHTIGYEDGGRIRPVIYRAALSEMVVPYGDPSPSHNRKNAFDVGEYGIGLMANALELGCDCLGEIRYFDAFLNNSRGDVVRYQNAVCLHEEDTGILWKHYDWRTNQTEVRRSRRLVVSFIATVGNYEYGFYWYFYQDGAIEYEVKLTGVINTGALPPGETRKYGTMVAPQLYAPNHQHFFNVRLDMTVDGPANSVYEVHTVAEPPGPENPHGNAFYAQSTLLMTEREAQQSVDPLNARYWKIVNPSVSNGLGQPVAYKLAPGENTRSFVDADSFVRRRAGFMGNHLWVTPYDPAERYAAGDYPNQHLGGAGLPAYTAQNRAIADTDLVVWYTMGHHHIPRPEDWPVMPVSRIGFMLKPLGFFDRNPSLDVPPEMAHGACCHEQ